MDMRDDSKQAIRNTLIYSDIFNYPLTFEQLYTFLISPRSFSKKEIKDIVSTVQGIEKRNEYYFLPGKEENITVREEREQYSIQKIEKAKKIAQKLIWIPTVTFIGVSGSVAMLNAEKEDDIDFFIITKKHTIWISRLLLLLTLQLHNALRTKNMKRVSDKICLNMIVDEDGMIFSKKFQDLYTAHEIAQLIPLIQKDEIYEKFLQKNKWVANFLPHALTEKQDFLHISSKGFSLVLQKILSISFIEAITAFVQKNYMKSSITTETISSSLLAFHPVDHREKTLVEYKKRIYEKV